MDHPPRIGNAAPIVPEPAPVELAGLTDPGRVRRRNEDAFVSWPEAGLALVADGMGGHARGDLASTLALSVVVDRLRAAGTRDAPAAALREAFAAADRALRGAAAADPAALGMGTTLLAVRFDTGVLDVAHAGDSRLYRLRGGELEALTRDHVVVGHGVATGALTRAVGTGEAALPEVARHVVAGDDLYLLCSDGLHGAVDDAKIRLTLQKFGANLGAAARELIRLANESGGLDNITVVLAHAP